MKRTVLLGLILLVVGALVFAVGFFGSGQNLSAVNGDLGPISVRVGRGFGGGKSAGTPVGNTGDKEYTVFMGGITYIELDENDADVVVTQSGDSKIHLIYQESADDAMEISCYNGKLTMKRRSRNGLFFFWFTDTDRRTELQIPHNLTTEVIVGSDNGSVTVKKVVISGDAAFSSGNGDVEIQTLYADKVTLENSNGGITAKDVHCADAALKNSNGKIDAADFSCASLEVRSSNGRITLTNVSAETTLYAKTSNGAVTVDDVSAGKSIELRSSNGSVRGTLAGSSDNYRITSKTSNGSSNLPADWGRGSILLTVETSNGSIDLNFTED